MGNKYRLAGWTFAVVLALGIAVALGASALVGSDWARQTLIQKLEAASGRRLHAKKLTLQLTPALRIEATQLSMSNPDWANADPDFLRAKSASFTIRLLPLLIGRIQIASVDMAEVQLFLVRSAAVENSDNWHSQAAGQKRKISVAWLPDHVSIRQATVQYRVIDGAVRRWQLPLITLNATAESKAQAEIQVLADDRMVHVTMHADNFLGFESRGGAPFTIDAGVIGQSSAGKLHVEGSLGRGDDLAGADLRVHVDAPKNSPWPALLGLEKRDLAAIKLDFALRGRAGNIEISQLAFALGDLRVNGQGIVRTGQSPWRIEGQLRTDFLDWAQMLRDFGLPPPPPKPVGAMFRDASLAWPLLQGIKDFTADIGLQLGVLKLRSGLPLQNLTMQMQLQADRMRVPAFSAHLFGGAMTAAAVFTAHDKHVKLNLKASDISIEQWREALHKPKLLSGGRLAVDANVGANGASLNQLAATMTGPVSLRMGRAVVHSSRAGEAESLLTGLVPALAGKRADRMDVMCVVASLPFENGRAKAASIAGARTESSQLLTDGVVDLHDQTLDLRGRVTGVNGVKLGASMLFGDVNIGGKLAKPHFRLDARGMAGTAARVGAAILSAGLTVVGQTLWDANADDACKLAR